MRLVLLVLGWLITDTFSSSIEAKIPDVKVLIAKKQKSITVQGEDLQKEIFTLNKKSDFSGRKTLRFNCKNPRKMKAANGPILVAGVSSRTGLVTWQGKPYRGELLLTTDKKMSSCYLVNKISLENYISALLSKEMNHKWPIEALKAQAVAARSYAYHKIQSQEVSQNLGHNVHYDLENSERHQVTGSFQDETKRTIMATKLTEGEILTTVKDAIIPVFFHAKCGGKTLQPHQVWGGHMVDYASVPCPFCHHHGKKPWKVSLKKKEFDKTLKYTVDKYYGQTSMSKLDRYSLAPDSKRRAELMYYSNEELRGVRKASLRSVLGTKKLPSNNFKIKDNGVHIEVEGTGHGHGVGMCQLGAFELARKGHTYKQILSYYYPKLKLKKIY